MKEIFQFIKADQFFPAYCPEIKNYKRKISGRSGKGQPLEFTPQEKKQILAGLKAMIEDYKQHAKTPPQAVGRAGKK